MKETTKGNSFLLASWCLLQNKKHISWDCLVEQKLLHRSLSSGVDIFKGFFFLLQIISNSFHKIINSVFMYIKFFYLIKGLWNWIHFLHRIKKLETVSISREFCFSDSRIKFNDNSQREQAVFLVQLFSHFCNIEVSVSSWRN